MGFTNPHALKDMVARYRKSGVFLSVLGFGHGNYNDLLMQELAQNGNGVAAYPSGAESGCGVPPRPPWP